MSVLIQSDLLEKWIIALVRRDVEGQRVLLSHARPHFTRAEVGVLWKTAARYTIESIWDEMLQRFPPPAKGLAADLTVDCLFFKIWAMRHGFWSLSDPKGQSIIQECLISNNEKMIPEYLRVFPWSAEKTRSVGVLVSSFATLDHFDWIELLWTSAPDTITATTKMQWLKKIESGFQDWERPRDGLEAPPEDSRWGRFLCFKEKMFLLEDGIVLESGQKPRRL